MISEIWSTADRIFCHDRFLPFYQPYRSRKSKFWKNEKNPWRYYHFTNVYHKWQSYDVWFLRYGATGRIFLSFWTVFFLPFNPPNNPKNQNVEKMKITRGDIILHTCTIDGSDMMYGFWDMEHDGQNFLLFWIIFCSFTP